MKKVKMVMALILALVFFAGCKKETQKEFTAELAKQNEMNAGEYSMVIDKVSIAGGEADAATRASMEMAAKMINGTKISGDYLKDSEKKAVAMNMNFDLFGQKIPLEFFMDQKKHSFYLSTQFLSEITEIAEAFDAAVPYSEKDLESLKGKYIHFNEEDMKDLAGAQGDTSSFSKQTDSKLFSEYMDTLDSDSFEKKDNTIKRKFTKKDIKDFIKYAKENGNKEEKKAIKNIEENLDELTKYEQTTTLNTEKHTQKTTLKIAAKNTDETSYSFEVTLNNKAKESKKKVQLPKEANTVTTDEVAKTFSAAQEKDALVSDEDFNDLLEAIRSGQTHLTQTQIDQLKRTYKPYLTEEQYKQLEEALDQSSQLAA